MGEWLVISHREWLGDDLRSQAAFLIATLASIAAAIDILVADEPSGWALAAAGLGVIVAVAALVGPVDGGVLNTDPLRVGAWATFAAGLFGLTTLWICRTWKKGRAKPHS